ncbi:MAG: hypothetical protein AAF846_25360 [Chloroflexota bacterium]
MNDFIKRYNREKFWKDIKQAHHLLRYEGRANEATAIFMACLNTDLIYLYSEDIFETLAETNEEFSVNWFCIYLSEYFHVVRGHWRIWMPYAKHVLEHPDFKNLPLIQQSQLVSTMGWAKLLDGRVYQDYQVIWDEQKTIFQQLPPDSIEAGCHHILFGHLAQKLRKKEIAMKHHNRSLDVLNMESEPFYYLLAKEMQASTLYYLRNTSQTEEASSAIKIYQSIQRTARQLNNGYDIRAQSYNIGWVKAEVSIFSREDVLDSFTTGQNETTQEYIRALYDYGIGYIHIQLGNFEIALVHFRDAIVGFGRESHIMLALCLQLKAATLQRQDKIAEARTCALNGLYHVKFTSDITQLYHLYRRLTELYFSPRYIHRFIYYLLQTYYLKIRLGKPLLRF